MLKVTITISTINKARTYYLHLATADFIHSFNDDYLSRISLSAQVAKSTFFMKSPVSHFRLDTL